jgi:hypothetical protein
MILNALEITIIIIVITSLMIKITLIFRNYLKVKKIVFILHDIKIKLREIYKIIITDLAKKSNNGFETENTKKFMEIITFGISCFINH